MFAEVFDDKCHEIFRGNQERGWWNEHHIEEFKGCDLREVPYATYVKLSKLLLMDTEIAETTEGVRKNTTDKHLEGVPAEWVELADTVIRIMDYAGAYNIPLGQIVERKLDYNAVRADHKVENRTSENGKSV